MRWSLVTSVGLIGLVATAACSARPTDMPTPAPFTARWTAQQVVDAFAAAGLPVAGPRPVGEDEKDWDATSAMVITLPATPTPADLQRIYTDLAQHLICPGRRFWPGGP